VATGSGDDSLEGLQGIATILLICVHARNFVFSQCKHDDVFRDRCIFSSIESQTDIIIYKLKIFYVMLYFLMAYYIIILLYIIRYCLLFIILYYVTFFIVYFNVCVCVCVYVCVCVRVCVRTYTHTYYLLLNNLPCLLKNYNID